MRMRVLAMSEQNGHVARWLAVACFIGLMSTAPAKAADNDGFFGGIMSTLGLKKDGASIDYRERSPLVIPPKRELPSPERAAAESNPAWPVDPDVKAAKEAAQPVIGSSEAMEAESRPLRPDQLTPGRSRTAKSGKSARSQDTTTGSSGDDMGRPLRPQELGYTGGMFNMFKTGKDGEVGKFVSEPPRATLTDPPTGYQTPSPNSPYGIGKDLTQPKPFDPKDRATQN
jgi:hypothetical protein